MGRQETLAKVESEILLGKLGVARDRLHGLVTTYPEDLSLRSRLGDVYWALGYPHHAGQWWFLDDQMDELKLQAVTAFLRSHSNNPASVIRALKLAPPIEQYGVKVTELIAECNSRGIPVPRTKDTVSTDTGRRWYIGCMVVLAILLFLVVVGLVTVVNWFY